MRRNAINFSTYFDKHKTVVFSNDCPEPARVRTYKANKNNIYYISVVQYYTYLRTSPGEGCLAVDVIITNTLYIGIS
jgi:hypothetical protein